MSNRAFGVEIECYSPEGEEDGYGEERDGVGYSEDILEDNGFQSWASLVSEDESLYNGYGVEIKSPVLVGSDGFQELFDVVKLLNDRQYWVDSSCGLHVHLNAPEFVENPRLSVKLVKAWMRNQHLINNMVAEHRLDNNHCEIWTERHLEILEEQIHDGYDTSPTHRGSINVGSLPYHGTVEIRQHEGTLNPEEIESWIKFCQAFVDAIPGTTVQKISTEELFLKRLKVERNASRFLTTKARLAKERRERAL